jgi:hypothetical protein
MAWPLAVAAGIALATAVAAAGDTVPEFYLPDETKAWLDYYSPFGNNGCAVAGGGEGVREGVLLPNSGGGGGGRRPRARRAPPPPPPRPPRRPGLCV